jgi:hypothetical protein
LLCFSHLIFHFLLFALLSLYFFLYFFLANFIFRSFTILVKLIQNNTIKKTVHCYSRFPFQSTIWKDRKSLIAIQFCQRYNKNVKFVWEKFHN